jgi:hypothetical protein
MKKTAISEPFIGFRLAPPADASCPVPVPSWLCSNRFLLSVDPAQTDTKSTAISATITSPNGNVTSLLTSGVVGL